MARKPAMAGRFYPAEPDELTSFIERHTPRIEGKENVLGALIPHAGYDFSGPTAAAVFARIVVPQAVVLLNPSHNFHSPPCALWTGGSWQTPLGDVRQHDELTAALARLPVVTSDNNPHRPEHSGEVVLPFVQYHRPDVRIAVVCITASAGMQQLRDLGEGIAEALKQCNEPGALVIASSDMSHEDGPTALKAVQSQDPFAIEQMKRLDPEGLVRVCREKEITMCGYMPAAAMMVSVRARGGKEGELIARATSADSPFGRGNYVVGYAGMVFR